MIEIAGIRENGRAACELVWEYLHPREAGRTDQPVIESLLAVWLLGRYDLWDLDCVEWERVLAFQYGMRLKDTQPGNPEAQYRWEVLFNGSDYSCIFLPPGAEYWRKAQKDELIIHDAMQEGHTVLKYVEQDDSRQMEAGRSRLSWVDSSVWD